jgi:hypothetical protein
VTQLELIPAARSTDPATSHEAAKRVTRSGLRHRQMDDVVGLVERFPGRTSKELAEISMLDRHMIARRLPDAEKVGLVMRGRPKVCSVSGGRAVTWWRAG